MKKRIPAFLLILVLFVTAALPVFAEGASSRLADNADILTSAEEAELLSLLDDISDRYQVDIVVVTVDTLDGKTAVEYLAQSIWRQAGRHPPVGRIFL